MKRVLVAVGPGAAALALLAAVPVFVATAGAVVSGAATFAFLGYRTYRRLRSQPS